MCECVCFEREEGGGESGSESESESEKEVVSVRERAVPVLTSAASDPLASIPLPAAAAFNCSHSDTVKMWRVLSTAKDVGSLTKGQAGKGGGCCAVPVRGGGGLIDSIALPLASKQPRVARQSDTSCADATGRATSPPQCRAQLPGIPDQQVYIQLAHTILGPRGARWGEIGLRGRGPLEARFPTFPLPHRLRSLPPDYASGGVVPMGRGGSVGTPKYIPQNDPHDALIILNIHKWGGGGRLYSKLFFYPSAEGNNKQTWLLDWGAHFLNPSPHHPGAPKSNPPPPLCDIPSGRGFFTGPWTVTRSSLRMLRRVAAFCRPLRLVLPLVSFPRSRSPVVGVLGLC